MNWRGHTLTDLRTIVELIANTTTATGLTIQAGLDPKWCPTGVKITDWQFAALPIAFHDWHLTGTTPSTLNLATTFAASRKLRVSLEAVVPVGPDQLGNAVPVLFVEREDDLVPESVAVVEVTGHPALVL